MMMTFTVSPMTIIAVGLLLSSIAIIYYFLFKKSKANKQSTKSTSSLIAQHELNKLKKSDNNSANSNNGEQDVQYLLKNLHPSKSTHLEILLYIATTPENISITSQTLEKDEELKQKRRELLSPSSSSKKKNDDINNDEFDLGGAWGDDDDEDNEATMAHKARQEEKERLAKEVAEASGSIESIVKNIKIEGIDEGVLGQKWVENTLKGIGQWPPKTSTEIPLLAELDTNPVVRRNVCMTMGRLNSQILNSSSELMEAGQKQLIDTLYFKSTMEYRKRTIVLLEAALRIIGSTRSYDLYKKLVECYVMFKVGTTSVTDKDIIEKFQSVMEKTFGGPEGIPRLNVSDLDVVSVGFDTLATEDVASLEMNLTRVHGENFAKQKIAMAIKQGIPPEIALQTFQEGWWILLRCEKVDTNEDSTDVADFIDQHPIIGKLSTEIKDKFKQINPENRLINAWPFIVSNMKQLAGTVKVRFVAPKVPGKYKFHVDIKSVEYLGCDQSFTLEKDILDKDTVDREEKKKEEELEGEGGDNDEPKKTK